MRSLRLFVTLALLSGCYASHTVDLAPDASARDASTSCDPTARLDCVTRAEPCDPLALVDPVCDEATRTWHCPPRARPAPPPWPSGTCVVLGGGVDEAPVPFPRGDRCAWWLPALELDRASHAHLAVDAPEPGTACTTLDTPRREPVLALPAGADLAGVSAVIPGADGAPRALVRGWALDPGAGFGVRALGVAFASHDGARFELPRAWLFDSDTEDFGDAALVHDGHVYAYGCPGPPEWLEEDCFVARAPLASIDDRSAWRIFGERGWGEGAPRRVFGSGPHRGPVVRDPAGRGFLHVYAIGFGSRLEITRAERPEGPWSAPRALIECELPASDPEAYCAGPGVHPELHDPVRPERLVVSYSIGTLALDGAERRARDPGAYGARVVAATAR